MLLDILEPVLQTQVFCIYCITTVPELKVLQHRTVCRTLALYAQASHILDGDPAWFQHINSITSSARLTGRACGQDSLLFFSQTNMWKV